jgi:precorrin-6B C5,15-methyltransferase / cobalt-precorrin-6B C5,C15-methyltransferase
MSRRKAITLVGIGDDGCIGLTSRAITAISSADILAGGERQLEFFPEFHGERIALRGGLASAIDRIAEFALDHSVCVLASGDPLFFGVGAQLIRKVGAEHVEVIAQPSSVQLAFSRIGVSWQDAGFLSVHGRPMAGLVTRLQRLAKAAILTDETNSPARVAAHLLAHGEIHWQAWVCECLGGPDERVRRFEIPALAEQSDIAALNLLVLLRADPRWQPPPMIPFLHEDEFAKRMPKKGLITKREVRLLSLAALAIHPPVWSGTSAQDPDRSRSKRRDSHRRAGSMPSRWAPSRCRSAATICAAIASTTWWWWPGERRPHSPSSRIQMQYSSAAARASSPRSSNSC